MEIEGEYQVSLDMFRALPRSTATGAQNIGRLTNLSQVNVDTSWYLRYRDTGNPDLGATYGQFINISHFQRPGHHTRRFFPGSEHIQQGRVAAD
jgi:hypothetical protein